MDPDGTSRFAFISPRSVTVPVKARIAAGDFAMSTQLKDIEERALQLPPAERELLAERLWQRLDDQPLSNVDEAWVREAEARYRELEEGRES